MIVQQHKDGILITPETEFEADYLQDYGPGEKLKSFVIFDEEKQAVGIKVYKYVKEYK